MDGPVWRGERGGWRALGDALSAAAALSAQQRQGLGNGEPAERRQRAAWQLGPPRPRCQGWVGVLPALQRWVMTPRFAVLGGLETGWRVSGWSSGSRS